MMTPAVVHHGHAKQLHAACAVVLNAAYQRHPQRFVRKPPVATRATARTWINKPEGGRSPISKAKRLFGLLRRPSYIDLLLTFGTHGWHKPLRNPVH